MPLTIWPKNPIHMNTKKSNALSSFRSGNNCAQAVLSTFTEDIGVDTSLALQLSNGFGAGMGRLQETCGAVTGAFMVFGIHNSQEIANNEEAKEKTIDMIQSFDENFIALHGSSKCKELLMCDLKTEFGQAFFTENKLSEKVCEKCVQNAVGILQEMLKTEQ